MADVVADAAETEIGDGDVVDDPAGVEDVVDDVVVVDVVDGLVVVASKQLAFLGGAQMQLDGAPMQFKQFDSLVELLCNEQVEKFRRNAGNVPSN